MTSITIIDTGTRTVEAVTDDARGTFLLDADRLPEALGWELKPAGLCRQDTCVPVADPASLRVGDRLDLTAVAAALGRPVVVDLDAGLLAVALPAELRHQALDNLSAPAFELPDLHGTLRGSDEWHGLKRLLVTFSSWCGCRYDLPGWQALHDELGVHGFTVIAVAIDHSAEDVRPWTEGITMPVLYDPQHLLTELYAISNVPTVVWIDEDDHIARPIGAAHGTDLFAEFTGIRAEPHLDEVRRWVRDGRLPLTEGQARVAVDDLSPDEVLARLHFRVASEAHRVGDGTTTRRHLTLASDLAPDDLTIWRAAMPLLGEDPFGDAFLVRYEEWRQKGSPAHGLAPVAAAGPVA
jgi:peroxiredoxin